jgi:midasin (ATPase involved in ribosome maturation)
MLLEEYISNKTLTGDKIHTYTQDYIYSTISLLSLAQNITYCIMFHSSQSNCTARYKTGILWSLQHYVWASAVTINLEISWK